MLISDFARYAKAAFLLLPVTSVIARFPSKNSLMFVKSHLKSFSPSSNLLIILAEPLTAWSSIGLLFPLALSLFTDCPEYFSTPNKCWAIS